jgi:hypothetical protein
VRTSEPAFSAAAETNNYVRTLESEHESRLLKNRRIELAMGCSEDLRGWLAGLRGVGLDEIGVSERGGMGIAAQVEIMPPG